MSGDLDHSPADVVRYELINQSVGTLPTANGSWPIFVSYERDNPDNCLTVYNSSAVIHGRHHATGETQLHYGIQVRIRSVDEATGFSKAQDVYNAFDAIDKETVSIDSSTYLFYVIHNTTGIFYLGMEIEASRRRLYTLNALACIRMTS